MAKLVFNQRAGYDYFLLDRYECGIVLSGAEVKSVRAGRASLQDSFVRVREGQAYLVNLYINPYNFADNKRYDPRRERKLLLHKKEIGDLAAMVGGKNTTIVALSMYDNRNSIKVEIAIGKGKKQFDKRAAIKKKDLDKKVRQEMGR